jgi:hypothetical protein
MSGKKWSRQTPGKIAVCLQDRLNIHVSGATVRRLLSQLNYSLKGNCKTLSTGTHPDRNEQFGIIEDFRRQFHSAGDPVISVDTKKKELIGLFKNQGKVWCQEAQKVKDHDFRSQALGIAAPYGIYDVGLNSGVVVVGQSADTPEFAVNSIGRWWLHHGSRQYPDSKRLLILADSGGSNGARPRAFKKFLQERIANEYGLEVSVCHYPAGASKWNPIEHRMFSEISKNWAGHPLESFEVLLHFVRNTRTESGLRIEAYLDEKEYEKGVKVSDKEFRALNISKNIKLGNWNYSIAPTQFPEEILLNSRRGNMQEPLEINDEWVKADRECSAISDCTIPAM